MFYFLIVFAAVCKAIADTIAHHKSVSVFKKSKFWSQDGRKIPGTKYKVDGWHICNSAYLVSWFANGFWYKPILGGWYDFAVGGIGFILVFNLFYNKILYRK